MNEVLKGEMNMRLSEAIRLGAMMGPQGRKQLFGPNGSTCALGGAILAVGGKRSEEADGYSFIVATWPWLGMWRTLRIAFRNDLREHSRQQIADWVATFEPAELEVGEVRNEQTEGRQVVPIPKSCLEEIEV